MTAVPPRGDYWSRLAPSFAAPLETMRQGLTREFDDHARGWPAALAWERVGQRIIPSLLPTVNDIDRGGAQLEPISVRGETYRATYGSVDYAAMASVLVPWMEVHFHDRPVEVLEIGAGYGGLARAVLMSTPVGGYTIVDLPEVQRCARYYLDAVPGGELVRMLTLDEFADDGRLYDVVVQTRGFMEMSAAELRFYFDRIQGGSLKQGGLLFSIQRNKLNQLADYPLDGGWRTILDIPWAGSKGPEAYRLWLYERTGAADA